MSFKTNFIPTLKRRSVEALRIIISLSLALITFLLIFRFILAPVVVYGDSMQPTFYSLQPLTSVPVNSTDDVQRNDIVLAKVTRDNRVTVKIIKRVVAIPGDTIEIKSNMLILNGEALQEDYILEPKQTKDLAPITLGENEYFILGDNRNNSADSRTYGIFTIDKIVSRVTNTNPWISSIMLVVIFAVAVSIGILFDMFVLEKISFFNRYNN